MGNQHNHGSSIKNDARYEALIERGYSKEKSARIANTKNPGVKGGNADPYEERSINELYELAKKIDIKGRSKMDKSELIHALRNN